MLRRNKKMLRDVKIATIAIGCTAVIGCGAYALCPKDDGYNKTPILVTEENTMVKTKPITIEEIKSISELNVLQVQTSKETQYFREHGWLFKTTKKLYAKYYFDVKYSIDLAKLTDKQIVIDGGTIKIYTTDLGIDISLKEEMTEYTSEKKGRFIDLQEIELTPDEYNTTIKKLKEEVIAECSQGVDYSEAITRAEENIQLAIKNLTKQDYLIEVIVVR